jgi:hypothetical protein
MKKILTEDLIDERLEAIGIDYDIDHDEALKVVKNHYEFDITDTWNKTPDYSIYAETTADGYEVWVTTSGDGRNVCINEDVHYYDHDLADRLVEAASDYNELIYVDDIDSDYVQDAVMQLYESYTSEMKKQVENELIEEGYEYEKIKQ